MGYALELGLISEKNGSFDPRGYGNRAAVAKVTLNFLKIKDGFLKPEPTPEPTPILVLVSVPEEPTKQTVELDNLSETLFGDYLDISIQVDDLI